ncbi:hypothetical protein QTP70_022779, partial [Hemibagrus guttatus]
LQPAMEETSEKIPIALAGPEDLQQFMPPAYAAVAVKPSGSVRALKIAVGALCVGAALLLLGAVGAFYFWNGNDKHVYSVHYSMSIDGKMEEGSMEIDTLNNLERFTTGSKNGEAVEVHDFQIGITGIRFTGGEKCYVKPEAKGHLPDLESLNKESLTFDLYITLIVHHIYFRIFNKLQLKGEQKKPVPRARRQAPEDNVSFNPNNPYHRREEGEDSPMTVDTMLDHSGVCCSECRRSYSHCMRVCEPLGGYEPWPYHYRGCRQVCRLIMPCSWWVARIMGLV